MQEDFCTERRNKLDSEFDFEGIIGKDPGLLKILDLVTQIANADVTVLIYGESGTGKELVARALHNNSSRKCKAFVPLNCGALSENLLDSQLFGHVRGAFTGALETKKGWFDLANGGTLLLDEIHEMSPAIQVKMLRVLQNGEYHRVGSPEIRKSNIRILAATNYNLEKLVEEGKFREELYYRLNVIDLNLPPLRERVGDIPLLIEHFLSVFRKKYCRETIKFSEKLGIWLSDYYFPGNIRQLKNIIERLVLLAKAEMIGIDQLPEKIIDKDDDEVISRSSIVSFREAKKREIERFERKYFTECLKATKGNKAKAARLAGIHVTHLHSKIKYYDLKPSPSKPYQ